MKDNHPVTELSQLIEPLHTVEQSLARQGQRTFLGGVSQSKAFDLKHSVNPIVAAAGSLLIIATQLGEQRKAPDFNGLYERLCEEIHVFENKVRALKYKSQVALIARYFMCSLIDETILTSEWGKNSVWKEQNLLLTFQGEAVTGERFFLILERIMDDAAVHIDLLELAYLCLSLGFTGQYREQTRGYHSLGSFIDHLYQLIQQQRGTCSPKLSLEYSQEQVATNVRWRLIPVWGMALLVGGALLLVFIPYHLRLQKMAAPVKQLLQTLQVKG